MIFLSDSSVRYAVDICRKKEGYNIVIAATKESRDIAIEKLLLLTMDADDVRIINSYNNFKIMFDNGSLILLISAEDSSRGHRAHLLVVDELASEEYVHTILRPMETLTWSEYREKRKANEETR